MTEHLLDDLAWRGLIAQTTGVDELRAAMDEGPLAMYCGFDPTAPSLHHGHLVQLVLLRHLQIAGHKVHPLVGGATGMIGDPRMSGERVLNTKETVADWVERLRNQISRFLDFEGDNPAVMVNNLDWTGELTAIDLLREIGKHFRLGTMLAKDTVARRLSSEEGISFTEFSYQVLQGNDFLQLHRRYGCSLQTGGNDQWGNLLSGVELIRKADGDAVHAMTTPLITKADGTKFGKTEGGAVWLAPDMMSPYAFYQFWINTDDADVVRFLKIFTFLSRTEIEALEQKVADEPFRREAQRTLAWEVTSLVHGEKAAQGAVDASQALFGRGDLESLDEPTLSGCAKELGGVEGAAGIGVADALVEAGIVPSKSAARRAIQEGGAYVNNVKVEDAEAVLRAEDSLAGGWTVLRRGKKTVGLFRQV
ncbi:tyrosine--tRNA ligase [Demequina zhanjiangensis]|uniref:Tyrosine--tRNA ligase n=1 Tax=Demequina zhanjiangensis TaxID=3051659 RepID=A0ABT8G3Q5_9MICO|nr:tyrosine--tRNA ligase [Demequina sp. SYSU T00b26]MDN4473781.1 tyrosine--tRNA ligase [Demequina sp. SYSU T00b26]